MAKLTRQQTRELLGVVSSLNRALQYVARDQTAICYRTAMATTNLHYSRADGSGGHLVEVEKEIGSDMTGIRTGLDSLKKFLDANM